VDESVTTMSEFRSEIRDGMRVDWDVSIEMDDGLVLRADVYRPTGTAKHPVILSLGPYGKWLHFEELYTDQWCRIIAQHPDVPMGSNYKYQNWEVVDPEKWVPDVHICVRIARPAAQWIGRDSGGVRLREYRR
jgi:hypothetical protein